MKHISEILKEIMLDLKDIDINKIYQDAINENLETSEIEVNGQKMTMMSLFRNYGHLIVKRSDCNQYLEMILYGFSEKDIMVSTSWSEDFLNKVKNNQYVKQHLK